MNGMGYWLAWAAKAARVNADIPQRKVAALVDTDTSRISRFEKGLQMPREVESVIDGYAQAVGIEPIQLWAEGLRLWSEDVGPKAFATAIERATHAGTGRSNAKSGGGRQAPRAKRR